MAKLPEKVTEKSSDAELVETVGTIDVYEYAVKAERGQRRFMLAGFLVVVFGFFGLGAWAALAPLQSAALAPGVVKVATERKTIQHLEGGIVKEILVKEDQDVQAGELLIQLDDTIERTRVEMLRSRLDRLKINEARLQAERTGRERINIPEDLLARRDEPDVAELLTGEMDVFRSRRELFKGQADVYNQRSQEAEEQIVGLDAQMESAWTQLMYIQLETKAAEELLNKGIYEKPKYYALKRTAAQLTGQIGGYRSRIAEAKERIIENQLRVVELEKQTQKEVNDELQRTRTERFDLEDQLRVAEDTLARTSIKAPQDGTVVGLQVHTVNGVIKQGADILQIVPKNDKLVVEAEVRVQDIDLVHEGLQADVRFTAFNMRTTPTLPGRVTRVSADRFEDRYREGMPYYLAQVEIDASHAADLDLAPGMGAEVYIVTGTKTTMDYLLKPIKDSMRRGLLEE